MAWVEDEQPTPASFEPTVCRTCLADVDPGAAKCEYCGSPFPGTVIPPPPPPPPASLVPGTTSVVRPMKKRSAGSAPAAHSGGVKRLKSAGSAPAAHSGGVKAPVKPSPRDEAAAASALIDLAASLFAADGVVNVGADGLAIPPSSNGGASTFDVSTTTGGGPTPSSSSFGTSPEASFGPPIKKSTGPAASNINPGSAEGPTPRASSNAFFRYGVTEAVPGFAAPISNIKPGLAEGPTPRASSNAFFRYGSISTEAVPGLSDSDAPSGGADIKPTGGIGPLPTEADSIDSKAFCKPDECLKCGRPGNGYGWMFPYSAAVQAAEREARETGEPNPIAQARLDLDGRLAAECQARLDGCRRIESKLLAAETARADKALHEALYNIAVEDGLLLCRKCAVRYLAPSSTIADGDNLPFYDWRPQ